MLHTYYFYLQYKYPVKMISDFLTYMYTSYRSLFLSLIILK